MKKAAVIIVNWNGLKFLKNCLSSVYKQTYKNFDVYFVDNGSIDESVNFVKNNFAKAKIIRLDKNYGFAKGNNEGIKKAFKDKKVEYIVCLNNDTIVDKNWLKELIKPTLDDKTIGATGSKILFYSNKNLINSLGIIPLKNGNALNYGKNLRHSKFMKSQVIFGPCGASALYTRRCLEAIGLFDEEYFCYLEDVDLAWRLNIAGFKAIFNPLSLVYHIHSGTSKNSNFKSYLIVRNSFYNLVKYISFKDILLYIPNTLKYYFLLKSKDNIGEEVRNNSKFRFISNILKTVPNVLTNLHYLINQRNLINREIIKNKLNKNDLIEVFFNEI